MSSNKGNFAVALAALALAISVYGVFTDNEVIVTQAGETVSSNNDEYNGQWAENNSNDSVNAEILELRRYILDLEERLNNQQFNDVEAPQGMPVQADFEDAVLEVIALKEEKDRQKLKEKNPMYGFYEDLPEDYEIRIKTDPDYARQVGKDLKAQIVDENLSATERLAAMSQLQMTMFMLNKTEMPEYDYEAVDAILSIGRNSSDDKVKIQALEVVAHTPVADARVSDSFMSLLEKEDNDYIRSMAAEGLVAQYYKSQSKQPELSKKVAQDILGLYDNASDAKLKQLFDNIIGDARMLDELRNAAGQ
ncbi:hypothetical protein CWB96_03470 [Pseudoalteromonas citrea]|uniref:HEAT repeat domain-containing protein n=1 Tax=Pseudoalteromonas citrea TaxID=43655 RepID=A0A5S3XV61_9GAMM|nr:hypothetical protein [Pseudoalteromonas citrea]TMP43176.1 hypothetical protein CWB97_09855 [Pseudoalteromonas citrea]TMP61717.1 hypothetical protein CWB96_03470 [Pseudoalteromonas citrea]